MYRDAKMASVMARVVIGVLGSAGWRAVADLWQVESGGRELIVKFVSLEVRR